MEKPIENMPSLGEAQPLIFDSIPISLDREALVKEMRADKQKRLEAQLIELIENAEKIATAKSIVLPVRVEKAGNDTVLLNGFPVTSRLVSVNLDQRSTAFATAVTVGLELDRWSKASEDILLRFWADQVCEAILQQAADYTETVIKTRFQLEYISWMTPGSLEDWPLKEQKPLFDLFGDSIRQIGVTLSEHFVMQPIKSLSGLIFPTDEEFFNCQICSDKRCRKRRAAYDPHMIKYKYQLDDDCAADG